MCWCCNQPLTGIRFERCSCTDICAPALVKGDETMPICFELDDVTFTAREGSEQTAFADAVHFETLSLTNMHLQGFTDPRVIARSTGNVILDEKIRVVKDEEGFHYTVT